MIALTALLFREIYATDIFLAASVRQPESPAVRSAVENRLEQQTELATYSIDRLLRIYNAATVVGDHHLAATTAEILADRVPEKRFDWLLTRQGSLRKRIDAKDTAAAFDRIIGDPAERTKKLEERADIYVEAGRAAIAVGDTTRPPSDSWMRAS